MARCQQLFGLLSRHNSDGYARPLDARMAMEDCQKGKFASGVATLKRALERAQILFRRRRRRLPSLQLPSSLMARSGTNRRKD